MFSEANMGNQGIICIIKPLPRHGHCGVGLEPKKPWILTTWLKSLISIHHPVGFAKCIVVGCNIEWVCGLTRWIHFKNLEQYSVIVSSYLYYTLFCDIDIINDLIFFIYLTFAKSINCHMWQTMYDNKFCLFFGGWDVGNILYLIQECSNIIFVFINFSECKSNAWIWQI